MELFWKASAGILIALVLVLTLGKQERDMGVLLTIAVCCMTGIAAIQLLEPVLDFLYALQAMAYMEGSILSTLFRLAGIGLVAELVSMICNDAGCSSLGKNIQLLASTVILYLSIPIFENLIELIREIMGGL